MSQIAAAFDLQPPIYLVKEFDNCMMFPSEGSGKFNPASLSPGSTYKVQGILLLHPIHHYISKFQKKLIKKTISVANLSARNSMKPSSSKTNGLSYTIVTQVIVSNNSSECNVISVSDMVVRTLHEP